LQESTSKNSAKKNNIIFIIFEELLRAIYTFADYVIKLTESGFCEIL